MNTELLAMVLAVAFPIAGLQSYVQNALTLLGQVGSAVQAWAKAPGAFPAPAVLATAIAAVLVALVCVILSCIRARRKTRAYRDELARLVALTEAAEAANQAKADLLTSMSQRIRTPMNAIVGFTERALKTDLDPELREYLDTVRTSTDWLVHIVNDVLEFSRIDTGRLELDNVPFSISECILSAMNIVERQASEKKLVTGCDIDPQLPKTVCGDPTRLRHVIFNLLDNAVRFTASGKISLSAKLESSSAEEVIVRLVVADTGVGISPATRSSLLERSPQAEPSAGFDSGTNGLGLTISRRLIELMGGTMQSESQSGARNTFEFTARFQKDKTAELSLPAPASVRAAVKQLPIPVAEDISVNAGRTAKTPKADAPLPAPISAVVRELPIPVAEDAPVDARRMSPKVDTPLPAPVRAAVKELPISVAEDTPVDTGRIAKAPEVHAAVHAPVSAAVKELSILVAEDEAIDTRPIARILLSVGHRVWTASTGEEAEHIVRAQGFDLILLDLAVSAIDSAETTQAIRAAEAPGLHVPIYGLAAHVSPADRDKCLAAGMDGFAAKPSTPDEALQLLSKLGSSTTDITPGNGASDRDSQATIVAPVAALDCKAERLKFPEMVDTSENAELKLAAASEVAHAVVDDAHVTSGPGEGEFEDVSAAIRPAVHADIEHACDIAINAAAKLLIADPDEAVLPAVNQSAEIITIAPRAEASNGKSDDNWPSADAQLSAPAGLALLEATSHFTLQATPLMYESNGPNPSTPRDPFEQARQSLSKSRFDVRQIHNDGDPSDKNLI